ncbi:MAG: hypothetical protein R2813_07925 [Flavobacteriales bacterium]
MQEIKEDKWLALWNLFDLRQMPIYALENRLYEISNIAGFLNDKYLVEAFDEIDSNLALLHEDSHFMYLYRLREEARLLYSDLNLTSIEDFNKIDPAYKYFKSSVSKKNLGEDIKKRLTKRFYLDLYNSVYFLHYNVEIEMNSLISNIPLRTKNENGIVSKEDHVKGVLEVQKSQVFNVYGGTAIFGNEINNITIPYERDIELSKKDECQIVNDICEQFKQQVENNGLHRLLYENDKKTTKHERVSQKLFFSVAQIFCIANNLDVSPETNSGNGSVDFKFSKGHDIKINVELKLSSSEKLTDGYTRQLEAYNKAEDTNKSFYVVIQVSENPKLEELKIKAAQNEFPILKIIDGNYKKTGSKI